jgi:hypothetical protein
MQPSGGRDDIGERHVGRVEVDQDEVGPVKSGGLVAAVEAAVRVA